MKTSSTASVVVWIIAGIFFLLFIWAVLAYASKQSSFSSTVSAEQIENLLTQKGLKVCKQSELDLSNTPGFESGKTVAISTNCNEDTNPMNIALLKFDSEASRNAALQRAATTQRSGYGAHTVYAYGPYVIAVQGTQTLADQTLIDEAMTEAGATQ